MAAENLTELVDGVEILPDISTVQGIVSERTPLLNQVDTRELLQAASDPKAFAIERAKGLLAGLAGPALAYVPDVEQYGNSDDKHQSTLTKALVELVILSKDTAPIFFTYIQEHSLAVAPTVAVGHLSTAALAASTISTMVISVTGYSMIQGFTSALDHHLASDGNNHHLARLWCQRTALVTALVLVPILNVWLHAEPILLSLGQDAEVAALASVFLKFTAIGLPAYSFNEIMKRYLTSQGLSSIHTRILTLVAPLNMILNYLLVNGPPKFRLGFIGAPVSMAISYNFISVMTIFYVSIASRDSTPSPSTSIRQFFQGIPGLLLAGAGGIGRTASECWSKDLGGFAASMLGPTALATQAVLLATASTAYQAPRALSSASSARVKKLLDHGDPQRARIAAVIALASTLSLVIMLSNIVLASAESWGNIFSSDTMVLQAVNTALPFIALFQAFHGFSAWVDGTLGAFGKSLTLPAISASADYCAGIPLGLWLAFGRNWGLSGLWAGLIVSQAYSSVVGTIILGRYFSSASLAAISIKSSTADT